LNKSGYSNSNIRVGYQKFKHLSSEHEITLSSERFLTIAADVRVN